MVQQFTSENISSRIEKIIQGQIDSHAPLSLDTNLQEDLGMDSLELVELGLTLENEFDVSIPDAEVRRCATLNDLVQLVSRVEQEAKSV